MGNTTMTEPTTVFGHPIDDYKADDGGGHLGIGSTAEAAQAALEHAQETDSSKSYHDIFGWNDTPK